MLCGADVNYKVVKDFVSKISERAVGQEVLESLTPGQQVIKIVHENYTTDGRRLLQAYSFTVSTTVYMMVGLQGQERQLHRESLQTILGNKVKSHYLLPAMYTGRQQ